MAERLQEAPPPAEDFPEPPRLRALRRATTALMVVLAAGVLVIVGSVLWGLSGLRAPSQPVTAEALTLPAGAEIVTVGAEADRVLIVVRLAGGGERLLTFAKSDGRRLSETEIRRAQ